ncbi:MAG: hypothetical protein CM1200mP2_46430 [Planctomycetaceae bacterium]|nr:MAG: hypothetical protein CM1200mP2_46430 [Planctomycetaceae bacterium]
MLDRLIDGSMPPKGKSPRPTAVQIERVRRWIQQGAAWPPRLKLSRYDMTTPLGWPGLVVVQPIPARPHPLAQRANGRQPD